MQNPVNMTDPTGMAPEGSDNTSPIFDSKTGKLLGVDDAGWFKGDVLFMDKEKYNELKKKGANGIVKHDDAVANGVSIGDLPNTKDGMRLFHSAVDKISKVMYKHFYNEDPGKFMVNGTVSVTSQKLSSGINAKMIIDGYGQNENFLDEDFIYINFDLRKDLNSSGNITSLFEHEYRLHGRMNLRQKLGKPDIHKTGKIYKQQVASPIFKYTTGKYRELVKKRAKE